MSEPHPALERVVAEVRAGRKYRTVAEALIRRIAAEELAHRHSVKEAVKATKGRLHQIGGAYLDRPPPYEAWLAELRSLVRQGDTEAVRAACRRCMAFHASTRERLPILDDFYATTLRDLGPIRSVLDVACGLNPVAVPWMPLAPEATYLAWDIYADMIAFVGEFFGLVGVRGKAEVRDVTEIASTPAVHLALVLKALPCLEPIDPEAGARLLRGIAAEWLLVSYPVRSLGGRSIGMAATYEASFRALLADTGWRAQRFAFPTELAFLVRKR